MGRFRRLVKAQQTALLQECQVIVGIDGFVDTVLLIGACAHAVGLGPVLRRSGFHTRKFFHHRYGAGDFAALCFSGFCGGFFENRLDFPPLFSVKPGAAHMVAAIAVAQHEIIAGGGMVVITLQRDPRGAAAQEQEQGKKGCFFHRKAGSSTSA